MAGRDLDLTKVDDTLLEEDDLTDITEAMQDVAANFPLIGTALHLMSGDVKIIRKECIGDYRSGLEQVILMWLKQNYNVDRFGEPTWRKVVQVVDKPNGGNNHALAKKIAAAHQVGVPGAPKKPNKSRAGLVNISSVQESGQLTQDVFVSEFPPSEPTHQYPGMTHCPQETSQSHTPDLNHNPHPLVRDVYSVPLPGDHPDFPQRFSSNPEGEGHKHPCSETHPQGHHQRQPGVHPRFQPGDQLTRFSQPAPNLYPSHEMADEPQYMGTAFVGGITVQPTVCLQKPGHNMSYSQQFAQGTPYPQPHMQSGTNTQLPTQGTSYPQPPMQSGTNTQLPTQGTSYPQPPMQIGTNTQKPTLACPQPSMQSGTNTPQPTQGTTYLQQPIQGGTNTPLPTQGTGHSQQTVVNNRHSQPPAQGIPHSQQFTQGAANVYQSVPPPGTTQVPPSTQMTQPAVQLVQRSPPHHVNVSPVPQPNAGYEASGDSGQLELLHSNISYQPMSSRFNNPSEKDEPGFKAVHVGLNVSPHDLPGKNNSTDRPSASPHPPSHQRVVSPALLSSHHFSTPPQASRRSSAPPQTEPALSHDTSSGASPPLDVGTSQSATGLSQQMEALKITDQSQQPRYVAHGQGAQNSSHFVMEGILQNQSGHDLNKSLQANGGVSSREVPADRDLNLQQLPGSQIGSEREQLQSFSGASNVPGASQLYGVGRARNVAGLTETQAAEGVRSQPIDRGQANPVAQQEQPLNTGPHSLVTPSKTPQKNLGNIGACTFQDLGTAPHSTQGDQVNNLNPGVTNPSYAEGATSAALEQSSHCINRYERTESPQQNVGTIGTSGSQDLHSALGGQLDTPAQSLTNSTLPSFPSDVERGGNLSESTLDSYSNHHQPQGMLEMSKTTNPQDTVPPPDQTQAVNPAHPSLANSTLPSFGSVPEVDRVIKPTGSQGELAMDSMSMTKRLQFHKTNSLPKSRVSTDSGSIDFQTLSYDCEKFGVVHPEKVDRQLHLLEEIPIIKPVEVHCAIRFTPSVPFIEPVDVIKVGYEGVQYSNENLGVLIDIPKGAVSKGSLLNLEVGVSLYGPFQFPPEFKPISPILMLCPQEDIQLQKAMTITLPHVLHEATNNDIEAMKADHSSLFSSSGGSGRCKFVELTREECEVKLHSKDNEGYAYATFELFHFCFVSLRARSTRKDASKRGYCICPVFPLRHLSNNTSTYHFCVTYFMKPCIEAIKKQFLGSKKDLVKRLVKKFTFRDVPKPFIGALVDNSKTSSGWTVALEFGNRQEITPASVDIWEKQQDDLELEIELKMYPPCFHLTVCDNGATDPTTVTLCFNGVEKEFQYDIILPWNMTHSTSVSVEGETKLTIKDLLDVKTAILDAAYLWKNIGAALGLPYGIIKSIHMDDDGECLNEVLSRWIHKDEATINVLLKALEHRDVCRNDIANNIRQKGLKVK